MLVLRADMTRMGTQPLDVVVADFIVPSKCSKEMSNAFFSFRFVFFCCCFVCVHEQLWFVVESSRNFMILWMVWYFQVWPEKDFHRTKNGHYHTTARVRTRIRTRTSPVPFNYNTNFLCYERERTSYEERMVTLRANEALHFASHILFELCIETSTVLLK